MFVRVIFYVFWLVDRYMKYKYMKFIFEFFILYIICINIKFQIVFFYVVGIKNSNFVIINYEMLNYFYVKMGLQVFFLNFVGNVF